MKLDEIMLIRDRDGSGVTIHRSARDACQYLEVVDVESGAYDALTASGQRVELGVAYRTFLFFFDHTGVSISRIEPAATEAETARAWLAECAAAIIRSHPKANAVAVSEASVEELIQFVGFTR